MGKVIVVFAAGPSASGKTEFSENLVASLKTVGLNGFVLSMDHYYKRKEDRTSEDFDDINAIDTELLGEHLRKLEVGEAIERPNYSFTLKDRLPETESIVPTDVQVIVVEGILALWDIKQYGLKNTYKVYIESISYWDYLKRRAVRDEIERGRTPEETKQRELHGVMDAFFSKIAPTKSEADIVVTNSGCDKDKALENINKAVEQVLPQIINMTRSQEREIPRLSRERRSCFFERQRDLKIREEIEPIHEIAVF